MSIIKNIAAIKNWYVFYAGRYGLLRNEFEIIHRNGLRLKLRPNTDDLKIVKSNFVTRHYMREFIPIKKDSIVVDAGAHIGSFSVVAGRIASKVFAFEPEPDNYQMLKKNIELNHLENIYPFQMAVHGSNGFQDIYIRDERSTGAHSLYRWGGEHLVKKRVQTISLDHIMEREDIPAIDFLKMDCEGAEYDIFKNLSQDTASKIMAIAMEHHGGLPEPSIDIPTRLGALGFRVWIENGYIYAKRISKVKNCDCP